VGSCTAVPFFRPHTPIQEEHVREKTLRTLLAAMLLTMLPRISAIAQNSAALSGVVKGARNGDALPGANVLLVGTGMGATSDVSGKYSVRNVLAGSYTVRVTYVGYKMMTRAITLVLGYDYDAGSIGLLNTVSRSNTDAIRNGETMNWRARDTTFTVEDTRNELAILSNILSVKQDIAFFHADLKASRNYSETSNPEDISLSLLGTQRG
jgi:hypothetical protein